MIPSTTTRSICPYCGVGCGVLIDTRGAEVTAVRGDPDHPANFGQLCSKGSALRDTLGQQGRILAPELRRLRAARREVCSWDECLSYVSARILDTRATHGPDALGFYLSGQLLTEDYYVFNKLVKGLLGTNNLDTNSRLCMSSAVAGYKATLGADAPPCSYEDIDHAELVVIAGANPAHAHPVLYRRLDAARRHRPALRTIVIDPRRSATADEADLHLAILPGTDVALFNGILHLLCSQGATDRDYIARHTRGFADLELLVRDYPPDEVARVCGIREEDLHRAAHWWAASPATLSLYCQGLNQSANGTANNAALINLHLATGQIGKPGAGPFSLTGQPNAMGGREVGGMANLLSAHRDLADPAARAEVATLWGVPSIPAAPGRTALEMFEAAADGAIRILWIACTNPAQSLPHQRLVRAALARAELVVLQEAFATTETAPFADVLLPAATWSEKEGTVTNSERRISRVRAAAMPPGQARPDWQIACALGHRLEQALRPSAPTLFPYADVAQIFKEHVASTAGQDLDMTGLDYAVLEREGPQQWPRPRGAAASVTRLYVDGRFPTTDGRAVFHRARHVPLAEATDASFPFLLNTGRMRDQWHGMTRSGRATRAFGQVAEPLLDMHPDDIQARDLTAGGWVRVRSRRGEAVLRLAANPAQRPGQVFMPMHWGSAWWSGGGVNVLTQDARDPISRQPELKACAVAVSAVELPWELLMIWTDTTGASLEECLATYRALFDEFTYASCGRIGGQRDGVILRAAHAGPVPIATLAPLRRWFTMGPPAECMSYIERRRGNERHLAFSGSRLRALLLAGDLTGHDWLQDWLARGVEVRAHGIELLAARARPPVGAPAALVGSASPLVCSCERVSLHALEAALASFATIDGDTFAALQAQTGCATGCGACVPEIRRLIARQRTDNRAVARVE